jgi:hypothetical protein
LKPPILMKMSVRDRIAELLLGQNTRAATAARLLSQDGEWQEAFALARAWKVIPHLSARIQSLQIKLTAEDTGTLRREFLRAYSESSSRATRTVAALRELEQARIPVVAFKGIASMAVLYDGPKQRTIGDGDLLIQRKDLHSALAGLEAIGFTRRGEETLAEYLNFVENAPRFAGNQAIALYAEDGSEIDLHWQIAGSGLHIDGILERSTRTDLLGFNIPVVHAKDGFLLTVHHATREDLAIESVCRDLLDVSLWCRHLEGAAELEAAMEWTARSDSTVAALAVTSLLRGYDDTTAPARAAVLLSARASPAQRRSAARLTRLFHYQLSNGRLAKDVFYLVHARPWRQIIKGLGTDWSGYRRSMATLETQLKETQPIHQRFVTLLRSMPGPRALRLARELARVKYKAN